MFHNQLKSPAPEELEVSLFGPGYGESVAVHIGNGQWILVDSCLEPSSNKPAAIQYLRNLNIDIANSVKLIVATHWHDDHIQGISDILSQCTSAKFVISGALAAREFLKLLAVYSEHFMVSGSGLDEFKRIFQLLDLRKQRGSKINPPDFASSNKLLYRGEIPTTTGKVEAKVFSLSPSSASAVMAMLTFANLLPKDGERKKRITSFASNHASVVLWVEVGEQKMLLGADLERTPDPKTGWSIILSESTVISGKAGVFKVPHHGAESAHEPLVWSQLLSAGPYAILSPFSAGSRTLPNNEDIERINNLTTNAYITAPPVQRRHRWANKVVRELVRDVTRDIHSVHNGWGQIRLRRRIVDKSTAWQLELFGDALPLKSETSSN
jgi:beta-lactamase superfamily II metal-dependent hydrolase